MENEINDAETIDDVNNILISFNMLDFFSVSWE
jgi:hypothetical protein